MAQLVKVAWIFYTIDKQKDGNTWLDIGLYRGNYDFVAGDRGQSGNDWEPRTINGPITKALYAGEPPVLKSDLADLHATVGIEPIGMFGGGGHNTWAFDYHIRLYWDDGTQTNRKMDANTLVNTSSMQWQLLAMTVDDFEWGDYTPNS